MTKFLFALLIFVSAAADAAPCTLPPKDGLKAGEVLVQVARQDGWESPASIYVAYPSTAVNDGCCFRAKFDERAWRSLLDAKIQAGAVTLPEFVATMTVPGSDTPLTAADLMVCTGLADRIYPPLFVVRNTQRADGARPLKVLRDPSLPYSTTNPLINTSPVAYVEAGRPCERTPVINTTSSGQWLYTTNIAGRRGIALCKRP
ncbi:MAG: hypothetical protein L0Y45_05270 [Woeseiaceae bacterium]|nr:hypothetical protein [Woeseiaceae bacterium]